MPLVTLKPRKSNWAKAAVPGKVSVRAAAELPPGKSTTDELGKGPSLTLPSAPKAMECASVTTAPPVRHDQLYGLTASASACAAASERGGAG
jgi:hypothetical protein